jgi:hypothetical protein
LHGAWAASINHPSALTTTGRACSSLSRVIAGKLFDLAASAATRKPT